MYENFPYTNMQNLNLDWFLDEFKKLTEEFKALNLHFDSVQEEYKALEKYVRDYFKNLDVQNEINNKMDALISSGEFNNILAAYFKNTIIVFNTVADMKNSKTLTKGSIIYVKGYFTPHDNGDGFYYIEQLDNKKYQISLQNNLYGSLYIKPIMYSTAFGINANTPNIDQTELINKALKYSKKIIFNKGTYLITPYKNSGASNTDVHGIELNSFNDIDFNDSIIKCNPVPYKWYSLITIKNCIGASIKNATLIGEYREHTGISSEYGFGVYVEKSATIDMKNIKSTNMLGDGFILWHDSKNITINNCIADGCQRQGISIIDGYNVDIVNCEIMNIAGTAPQYGIDIESELSAVPTNINIKNCYIHDTVGSSIGVIKKTKNVNISDCDIDNIHVSDGAVANVNNITCHLLDCNNGDITLNNCIITNSTTNTYLNVLKALNTAFNCKLYSKNYELNNCTVNDIMVATTSLKCYNSTINTTDDGFQLFSDVDIVDIRNCIFNALYVCSGGTCKSFNIVDTVFNGLKSNYQVFPLYSDMLIKDIYIDNVSTPQRLFSDVASQKIRAINIYLNIPATSISSGTVSNLKYININKSWE